MRFVHYLNDDGDVTACGKRLTPMTLHSMIAYNITCPACLNTFDTYPA